MKKITVEKLVSMLKSVSGTTFVGLTYESPAPLSRNPWGVVTKVQHVSGLFGADYGKMVENTVGGDYEVRRRVWGTNVGKGIIEKDGTPHAVQLAITNPTTVVKYLANGFEVSEDNIAPFMKSKSDDSAVNVKAYRFDRISEIRINGDEYKIVI